MSHDADESKNNKRRKVVMEEKSDDFFKESDFYLADGISLNVAKQVTKRANEIFKSRIEKVYIVTE